MVGVNADHHDTERRNPSGHSLALVRLGLAGSPWSIGEGADLGQEIASRIGRSTDIGTLLCRATFFWPRCETYGHLNIAAVGYGELHQSGL